MGFGDTVFRAAGVAARLGAPVRALVRVGMALAACTLVRTGARADDCVGWLRVGVPSNGVAAVALPFEPLGDGGTASFLSGPFAGDAAGPDAADEIIRIGGASGDVVRAVWADGSWREPAGGVSAAPSDSLLLRLLPSDPFDVFVFGRLPGTDALSSLIQPGRGLVSYGYPSDGLSSAPLPPGVSADAGWAGAVDPSLPDWAVPILVTNANPGPVSWVRARPYPAPGPGGPRVLSMSVDGAGGAAEFTLDCGGAADVLRLVSPGGFPDGPVWEHLARIRSAEAPAPWRDGGIAGVPSALYLFSDAVRDSEIVYDSFCKLLS